jgi:hypothetical protein
MPIDPDSARLGFHPHSQEIWQSWGNGNPHAETVRFGVVVQANTKDTVQTKTDAAGKTVEIQRRIPGTVDVLCHDGTKEINVQLLSDPVDPRTEAGEFTTAYVGSQCCLITGPGGTCWAVGFIRSPTFGYSDKNGRTKFKTPKASDVHGDWVRSSNRGQAEIRLTGGGLIVIASTPACRMVLNPSTGEWSMASQIMSSAADGYTSRRGRLPGNQVSPDPRTLSKDTYLSLANALVATHVVEERGAVTGTTVRRVSVLAGGTVLQGRETLDALGNFVGAFRTYRYGSGSAGENFVLGQVTKKLWSDFLDLFAKHTHQSAMGPTTPPVEVADALTLKAHPVADEAMLSSFMFTQKLGPL